jgi:hypothetical protein
LNHSLQTELIDGLARLHPFGTHERSSEVAIREQGVVRATNQSQVLDRGFASSRIGVVVMQLEKPALRAALAFCTYERALPSVTLVNLANHCARDVAR